MGVLCYGILKYDKLKANFSKGVLEGVLEGVMRGWVMIGYVMRGCIMRGCVIKLIKRYIRGYRYLCDIMSTIHILMNRYALVQQRRIQMSRQWPHQLYPINWCRCVGMLQ